MKVLMFGWEFPPYFAGGVGTVCYQLSKALCQSGTDLTFIMPATPDADFKEADNYDSDFLNMIVADNYNFEETITDLSVDIKKVKSLMTPYMSPDEYEESYEKYKKHVKNINRNSILASSKLYGENLLEEIWIFAEKCKFINYDNDYDLIHAHDWTTFPAAVEMKKHLNIPLAVHVHITEFDKNSGNRGDERVHNIEKYGMDNADVIICISQKIKDVCVNEYGQDPNKCVMLYNGAEEYPITSVVKSEVGDIKETDKVVLYAGRVAPNKGADKFVDAAIKVANHMDGVKFVVAGTGTLLPTCLKMVEESGNLDKFLFTGFYHKEMAVKLFNMADVFVMPSVSEPFGIVPFEAMWANTPSIISKQSGIAEVVNHVVKVDFWDTDKMADAIVNIIEDKTLHNTLKHHGKVEVQSMTWDTVAEKCGIIYENMIKGDK